LSADIAEKSRVNDDAETAGVFALGLLLPEPEPELELLPHAAAVRLRAAAPAVTANLAATCFNETTLFS
jgi:hypothetical protein